MNLEAIQDFYLMEAMLSQSSLLPNKKATDKWVQDASEWNTSLSEDLALALRDYLFLAACGEARYSRRKTSTAEIIPDIDKMSGLSLSRTRVYEEIVEYDPDKNIDQIIELFDSGGWKGGMGGPRWAAIAKAIKQYREWPAAMFIDHVIDLQHNNGTVFNKPTENIHDFSFHSPLLTYLKMWLDFKSIENIIDNKITITYVRDQYNLPRPIFSWASRTKTLYQRFLTIQGEKLPSFFDITKTANSSSRQYIPLKWGTKVFQPTTTDYIRPEGNDKNPFDPTCCDECEAAYHQWNEEHGYDEEEPTPIKEQQDGQKTQEKEKTNDDLPWTAVFVESMSLRE